MLARLCKCVDEITESRQNSAKKGKSGLAVYDKRLFILLQDLIHLMIFNKSTHCFAKLTAQVTWTSNTLQIWTSTDLNELRRESQHVKFYFPKCVSAKTWWVICVTMHLQQTLLYRYRKLSQAIHTTHTHVYNNNRTQVCAWLIRCVRLNKCLTWASKILPVRQRASLEQSTKPGDTSWKQA